MSGDAPSIVYQGNYKKQKNLSLREADDPMPRILAVRGPCGLGSIRRPCVGWEAR